MLLTAVHGPTEAPGLWHALSKPYVACVELIVPNSTPVPAVVDVVISIWPKKERAFPRPLPFQRALNTFMHLNLIKTLRPLLQFLPPKVS